jgi:lisH domain-containing protein FOPNL
MSFDAAALDLKGAIINSLESKGVITEVKARIRAEIYQCFESQESGLLERSPKPHDLFIACELMRDLMVTLDYKNTMSVFSLESGQPPEMRVDREFILSELGMASNESPDFPILFLIIRFLKDLKENRIEQLNSK